MNEPTELEREFCLDGWGEVSPGSHCEKPTCSQPPRPKRPPPERTQTFQIGVNSPVKDWLALNAVWIFSVSFATLSVCGWLFNFFMNPL